MSEPNCPHAEAIRSQHYPVGVGPVVRIPMHWPVVFCHDCGKVWGPHQSAKRFIRDNPGFEYAGEVLPNR